MTAQCLRRKVIRRLRIEVVPTVACQEREVIRLEPIRPGRNEVLIGNLGSGLYEELVEGLPKNGVRIGVLFDSLAMDVMSEFTSELTQLFEPFIQCVRVVVSLVDDPAMLKRIDGAINGAPMNVGTSSELRRGTRCIEINRSFFS